MNFDTFLLNFYRTHNPSEQRIGQYFMNELCRVNRELYRTIPADLDPYYDDKFLNQCIDWVSDRWVDDDDDEKELIHRAVRNGADLDSL
jgi:hypothetical protein